MGIRMMKSSAHGRRPGSRNYTKEFREAVVAEANDPNRSIAEVARTHGLNANMVAQWRRKSLDVQRASAAPCVQPRSKVSYISGAVQIKPATPIASLTMNAITRLA
ncbi:transposase [Paraburkholderia tropica]